jgi:hypothetical protein
MTDAQFACMCARVRRTHILSQSYAYALTSFQSLGRAYTPSFSRFHRAGTTPENSDIPEMVAARQRGELEAVRSGELPYEELLRRANEERDAIASAAAAATATAGR